MSTATIDRTNKLEGTYVGDAAHSSFGFAVTYQGVSLFKGTLEDVEAKYVADENGAFLEGVAKVESISIRSPQQLRDHVVHGEDFFAADKYPEVSFRSSDIQLNEDGSAVVEGELTVKDQTHAVTATGTWAGPVEAAMGITRAHLHLEATIDRTQYGLTWQMDLPNGGKALADDVTLTVDLALLDPATLPAE